MLTSKTMCRIMFAQFDCWTTTTRLYNLRVNSSCCDVTSNAVEFGLRVRDLELILLLIPCAILYTVLVLVFLCNKRFIYVDPKK